MPSDQPDPSSDDFDARVRSVAALGEPVRRALYRYVVDQPEPVSRDAAAAGTGLARHTAKFHLDRLVADGLLAADFSRPEGRGGPGAGRPAKRYRRADREIEVSLPERRYELAGHLLARAVSDADRRGVPVRDALRDAAHDVGHEIGAQARGRVGARGGPRARWRVTADVLGECGYEPRAGASGLLLANCPFHALAQDHTELVCGMNLDLLRGLADGLGDAPYTAELDPAPGRCCVRLSGKDAQASR